MNLSDARFKLLLYLGSLTFILYLDRVCIGKAASAIEQELGISDAAMGWVFTAFTIAYGLFEVPTGSWGDRYGSRRILTRIVLWWSAFVTFWSKTRHRARAVRCPSMFSEYCHQAPTS